jgi:hypothetical protein
MSKRYAAQTTRVLATVTVLLSIALVCGVGCEESSSRPRGISLSQYNEIEQGMSYEQVASILGDKPSYRDAYRAKWDAAPTWVIVYFINDQARGSYGYPHKAGAVRDSSGQIVSMWGSQVKGYINL